MIKFFEKGLVLDYLMIIAKVFEYISQLSYTKVKLKVLND